MPQWLKRTLREALKEPGEAFAVLVMVALLCFIILGLLKLVGCGLGFTSYFNCEGDGSTWEDTYIEQGYYNYF